MLNDCILSQEAVQHTKNWNKQSVLVHYISF